MNTPVAVACSSPCLARQNDSFSTGNISICLDCHALRYGANPTDERCCHWYTCRCPVVPGSDFLSNAACCAAECTACAIFACGEPLHYHHDGCPKCDMPPGECITNSCNVSLTS